MNSIAGIPGIAIPGALALSSLAFFSALVLSLLLVPAFRRLALRSQILDLPGGRKEHQEATPLFGGVGILLASVVAFLVVKTFSPLFGMENVLDLRFGGFNFIIIGSLVIFATGLIDDLFKDRLPFYCKLLGQIIGSSVAMIFLFYPQIRRALYETVPFADYVYLLILMVWMLTVINSFNFSDNINGLSSGLAIIALLTSMVYLGSQVNTRFILVGLILVGSILGFMPYNFPRARIFLGDAGSMYVGYWVGVILWPLTGGFFDGTRPLFGLDHLIPPVLVLGVPLFDAAFVVIMRWREGRPIYLGDNQHMSHRLVRGGFSHTESVLLLWGIALILGGLGAMSISADFLYRYMALLMAMSFMLVITVLIVKRERKSQQIQEAEEASTKSRKRHGSSRIRADVPN